MLTVPIVLQRLIVRFAPRFSKRVWEHAPVLGVGALLAPGKRTVPAVLRGMGLSQERQFQTYHRVLNRARWSSLAAARVLRGMVGHTFVPAGPVVIGIDATRERRRGEQLKAKGISRDPGRSSHSHRVKASGLRWLGAMVVAEMPWAERVWALAFLTLRCPSARSHQQRGRRHKTLPERAGQLLRLRQRGLPRREVVVVADSSYAVIELLSQGSAAPGGSLIPRLRLEAALENPAPPRAPRQNGRSRKKGARRPTWQQALKDPHTQWTPLTVKNWDGGGARDLEVCPDPAGWDHTGLPPVALRWVLSRDPYGEFEPQALLSTPLTHTPTQILEWFVRRWTMAVTLEESRAHLGLETQRQWHERAISRTTPTLFGLYSWVTRRAHALRQSEARAVRTAAWSAKSHPTFVEAIALVRRALGSSCLFAMSEPHSELIKIPRSLFERLTDTVCYAA